MSQTEVSNEPDTLESSDEIKHEAQNKAVTRTVWLKLPEISLDVVQRLRRLYTKAIRRFVKCLMEGNYSEKQIYHELRKHPTFSKLPARMLDRAGREAFTWVSHWKRERILSDATLQSWTRWATKNGSKL